MKSERVMFGKRNWGMGVVVSGDGHLLLVPPQPPSATVSVSQMAKRGSTILCSGEVVDPPGEEERGPSADAP